MYLLGGCVEYSFATLPPLSFICAFVFIICWHEFSIFVPAETVGGPQSVGGPQQATEQTSDNTSSSRSRRAL
jgi:hypothetical protein